MANAGSGHMIAIPNGSRDEGVQVFQYTNAGNPEPDFSMMWHLIEVPGGYAIYSRHSDKVLAVKDGSKLDGTPVVQTAWEKRKDQIWKLERTRRAR